MTGGLLWFGFGCLFGEKVADRTIYEALGNYFCCQDVDLRFPLEESRFEMSRENEKSTLPA